MSYYHHLIKSGSAPSYGALTTAWISATSETDTTIISALNTLETDLTTYGLTSKIKALYPMVGGTAAKHKFNFMDARDLDAAFRLTFSGGWTHASTGAKPNGTNAYANTFLTPSTSLSLNSSHLSFYSRTNVGNGQCLIGTYPGGSRIAIYNNGLFSINSNAWLSQFILNTLGFYGASRTTSSNTFSRLNNTNQTNTQTSTSLSANVIELSRLGSYAGDYSANECAFATVGDGLTDTELTNLNTAVTNFNTSLSRQV